MIWQLRTLYAHGVVNVLTEVCYGLVNDSGTDKERLFVANMRRVGTDVMANRGIGAFQAVVMEAQRSANREYLLVRMLRCYHLGTHPWRLAMLLQRCLCNFQQIDSVALTRLE